ncbi:MAG: hypothetical protein Q9218_005968 [Villophora microphyllina]
MAGSQVLPVSSHQGSPGEATDSVAGNKHLANLSTIFDFGGTGKKEESPAKAMADIASFSEDRKPKGVPEAPFPFMKLPLELRNMVYREILQRPKSIIPYRLYYWRRNIESLVPTCRIFLVSKALYDEAVLIFFGYNTFDFISMDILEEHLATMKVECRRQIRSIVVGLSGDRRTEAAKLLRRCVSLRHLSIGLGGSSFRFATPHPPWVLKPWGVQELLKVRGLNIVEVVNLCSTGGRLREEDSALLKALQVLKQPYSAAALRKQDKVDFPPKKAQRSVYGKTNVMTRSERKMVANDGHGQA